MSKSPPPMIIADIQLHDNKGPVQFAVASAVCDHAWEPHLWDDGRAYCHRCGSFARWANDPREAGKGAT